MFQRYLSSAINSFCLKFTIGYGLFLRYHCCFVICRCNSIGAFRTRWHAIHVDKVHIQQVLSNSFFNSKALFYFRSEHTTCHGKAASQSKSMWSFTLKVGDGRLDCDAIMNYGWWELQPIHASCIVQCLKDVNFSPFVYTDEMINGVWRKTNTVYMYKPFPQ